jgi:WXG100 protein secretion system (Wss), protein YukD
VSACRATRLVTVRLAEVSVDVELSADCPVADLLPGLLALGTADGPSSGDHAWRRSSGAAIAPTQSLADAGVFDGETLSIRTPGGPEPRPLRPATTHPAPLGRRTRFGLAAS